VNRWPFGLSILIRKTVFVQLAVYIRCIMHLMLAVVSILSAVRTPLFLFGVNLAALSRVSLLPVPMMNRHSSQRQGGYYIS
jgi:uncharacterized membrane protein YccF (DUF307 family)